MRAQIYEEVATQDPDDISIYSIPWDCPIGPSAGTISRSIDGLVLVNCQVGTEAKAVYYDGSRLWLNFDGIAHGIAQGIAIRMQNVLTFGQIYDWHSIASSRFGCLLYHNFDITSAEASLPRGRSPDFKSLQVSFFKLGCPMFPISSESKNPVPRTSHNLFSMLWHRRCGDLDILATVKELEIVAALTGRPPTRPGWRLSIGAAKISWRLRCHCSRQTRCRRTLEGGLSSIGLAVGRPHRSCGLGFGWRSSWSMTT